MTGTTVYIKYYSYPVSTDVSLGDSSNISASFPTITFCLNSMHSASKVKAYHPADTEFLSSLGFLYGYYYDTHSHTLSNVIKEIREHGKSRDIILSDSLFNLVGLYNVNEVYKNTYHPFKLIACSFLNQPCANHVEYGEHGLSNIAV